jgi:hypothetical protein
MPDSAASRVYGLHGLRVRSTVALAGFPLPDGACDVDVRWGPTAPVPADPPPGRLVVAGGPERYRYFGADDGRALVLRLPGVCDFVIDRELGLVECRPDPATDARFVAILVAGLVVSVLLGLGGHFVMHASAVEVGGRAMAFAGLSGAGKSTLAALLCGAGARLVTDDVLRVGTGPGPVCVGGAPELRLRPGSEWALRQFENSPPSQPTVDLRTAVTPPPVHAACIPLSVIVLPCVAREATEVEVRPLTGSGALARMVGALRVPGWKDPEVMRRQFQALARTIGEVPVVEAVLPWKPESRSSIASVLLDLLRRQR